MTDARSPETQSATPVESLTFEQALERLEQIVQQLESGQAPLERSIDLYAEGAALKAHCEKRLEAARLKVERIRVGPDGSAQGVEPAEFP